MHMPLVKVEIMMLAEVATEVIIRTIRVTGLVNLLNPICIVSRTFESIVFL